MDTVPSMLGLSLSWNRRGIEDRNSAMEYVVVDILHIFLFLTEEANNHSGLLMWLSVCVLTIWYF